MDWQNCKAAFYVDGSLRDIYVQDTTTAEWDTFLEVVSSKKVATFVDGEPHPIPTQASDIFEISREKSVLLEILLGQVRLNCHFFTEEEIELDIDPSQVTSQTELDAIVDVLDLIGCALDRDVIFTDENSPTFDWFVFDAEKADVRFAAN